jgi:hypothetical protein
MSTDPLLCCICLFVREKANEAETIINGQAVCADHLSYVQGGDFSVAIRTAKREEAASETQGDA